MGADLRRLNETRFRHKLRKQVAETFGSVGMFSPDELTTFTYPCVWRDETKTFPVGTKLVIFQRGPRSRAALMHGINAVAEFRGSIKDLQQRFASNPKLGGMLEVTISRSDKPSEPFYVKADFPPTKKATN